MCGRVIQSSGPLRYGLIEGLDARDSRVHNYPPRWNAAPSQDLLVIRRNHQTGQVSLDPLRWGLIPYWCEDPKGGRKHSRQAVGQAGSDDVGRTLPGVPLALTSRPARAHRPCRVPSPSRTAVAQGAEDLRGYRFPQSVKPAWDGHPPFSDLKGIERIVIASRTATNGAREESRWRRPRLSGCARIASAGAGARSS
jgi:hypothetical protein